MSENRTTERKMRRNTPQRRVILEELCASRDHPTAADIYDRVRRRLPRVSLGTVYRNLEVLHHDGMIRKMEFAGNETRYDGELGDHYHVRCTGCGEIADVYGLRPEDRPAQPEELAGFKVQSHRLEYFGLCPSCR